MNILEINLYCSIYEKNNNSHVTVFFDGVEIMAEYVKNKKTIFVKAEKGEHTIRIIHSKNAKFSSLSSVGIVPKLTLMPEATHREVPPHILAPVFNFKLIDYIEQIKINSVEKHIILNYSIHKRTFKSSLLIDWTHIDISRIDEKTKFVSSLREKRNIFINKKQSVFFLITQVLSYNFFLILFILFCVYQTIGYIEYFSYYPNAELLLIANIIPGILGIILLIYHLIMMFYTYFKKPLKVVVEYV